MYTDQAFFFSLLLLFGSTVSGLTLTEFLTNVAPKSMTAHYRPVADLEKFSLAQTGSQISLRLDVHKKKTNGFPRAEDVVGLSISGLKLNLASKKIDLETPHVNMPGVNGPHPAVSSGIQALQITEPGRIIDMTGSKNVGFEESTACWELIWRENARAGYLICGLELTSAVARNNHEDATVLPAGSVYISFPVWKRETLEKHQEEKAEVMEITQKYLDERDNELRRMQQTNNLLQKALHYRNAAAANERYSLYPVQSMIKNIPDAHEVIPAIGGDGDLLLTTVGTIWTKDNGKGKDVKSHFQTALSGPTGRQILLGTAVILELSDSSKKAADSFMELRKP